MRNYLAHFHFITKLLLIIIPPMMLVLYFTVTKVMSEYTNYTVLEDIQKSITFSGAITTLIYELQLERGMSAGYIGAQGLKFSNELNQKRKQVDIQVEALKNLINDYDNILHLKKVNAAISMSNNIAAIRIKVNKLSIPLELVLDFYTGIITQYLENISLISKHSDNAWLTRELSAYSSLLFTTELMGIERAIGANTFGNKKINLNVHKEMITLVAEQKTFLKFFLSYSSDESLGIYTKIMKTQSFEDFTRMEELLLNTKDSDTFNIDAQYWFDEATKKINILQQISSSLATQMGTYISNRESKMYRSIIEVLAMNIIIVLIIMGIVYYVSLQLYREINEQQKALIQQSKMAAIGDMISSIAHQWRQPLNAVGVLAQEIQLKFQYDSLSKEEAEKLTNELQDYLEYMSKTIDDFRNFYKPSKQKASFDLINSINESLKIVGKQLQNNNIKFTLEQKCEAKALKNEPEAYFFEGYESEFKQVIISIINNASEAIQEYSKIVDLKQKEIKVQIIRTNNNLIVKISDNGRGIKPDILEHIFEPYLSTKHEQQGTGLGLYMSKLIIERNMFGKLSAKNISLGAEFEIALKVS